MKSLRTVTARHRMQIRTRRRTAVWAVPALLVALVPAALVATASPAAAVDDPSSVSVTLEGCRGSAGILPNGNGDFVCPDALYTTGNLGGGWNELDLVPHRLTLSAGNSAPLTQTYKLAVMADNVDAAKPGYDFMSTLTKNTALSTGTCVPTISAMQTSVGPGGTTQSIYRTVELTQARSSKCVFDYYERLALGSHLFPGSSLHSNAANQLLGVQGIGARDVSIPVKEIQPQSIDKNVSASRGSGATWGVSKSSSLGSLSFTNSCATGTTFPVSTSVQITVSWTKVVAANGQVTIVTYLYASNPAHRVITVNVNDVVTANSTNLYTIATGDVDVPANSTSYSLLGYTAADPTVAVADTRAVSTSATTVSDTATATYTDKVTGIAVPGTTSVSKNTTVADSGTTANGSATITDTESITGNGLTFSVASPSVGAFTDGYVAGTATTGPVGWSSGSQTAAGSVTFTKTVYLDQARVTSGTLTDTAHLNGVDSQSIDSNTVNVGITSTALVSIPITKNIPNVLTGSETASFTFHVLKVSDDIEVASKVISFTAGQTSKTETVSGLAPDVYYVTEDTATGWNPQGASGNVDLSVQLDGTLACSGGVTFTNTFGPATARAIKATTPAGSENGWSMCLTGPGTEGFTGGKECVTTAAVDTDLDPLTPDVDGVADFTTALQQGSYTITEVMQTGWEQAATPTGDCSFTVNYPADNDRLFTCSFSNRALGTVTVHKTVDGQLPAAGAYSFQVRTGASTTSAGTVVASDTNDAAGVADFNPPQYFTPGTYQVCEVNLPLNAAPTFSSGTVFVPTIANDTTVDNTTRCVQFTLTAGQSFSITVDNHSPGDARTIGYWKNWSGSCNGGHQADSLGTYLGAGIAVGNLFVDRTCAEAVPILNKSDIVSLKKMASNPAYNMAAQFLAAKLNVAKGVATCTKVANTLVSAQALLVAVNFVGTGTPSMSKTQQTAANTYASILDNYNNNNTSVACT